jgi:predicted transcriptional regulator
MKKDIERYGLMKIPSEVVIKELRMDLGKLKSYIQELEERIKLVKEKDIKYQTLICLEGRVKNLEKKLEESRKECNKVVEQNLRLKKQLFIVEIKKQEIEKI